MCLSGLSTVIRSSGLLAGIVLIAVARLPSVAAAEAWGDMPPPMLPPLPALPREIG